jgi:hypothetical protein
MKLINSQIHFMLKDTNALHKLSRNDFFTLNPPIQTKMKLLFKIDGRDSQILHNWEKKNRKRKR